MEVNVIKLAFLLSYLTLLICLVSGIPFMTALFRSIILMVIFSSTGLALRWYLLKMITTLQVTSHPGKQISEEWETPEEEESPDVSFAPSEQSAEDATSPSGQP
ncbi:MAG: hypothetical protein JXQ83_14795 [Candidatus Glassbacteria bacterium]|nr:hypothetical protein [Candidatus Glassbacteria bacterium]